MTYQSELLRRIAQESGEGCGHGGPQGQVVAADDEDYMDWQDFEEQMQDPIWTRAMRNTNSKRWS